MVYTPWGHKVETRPQRKAKAEVKGSGHQAKESELHLEGEVQPLKDFKTHVQSGNLETPGALLRMDGWVRWGWDAES